MGDTTMMTREQQLVEEFKTGLSPDDAPALAKRMAALEADRDAALDLAGKDLFTDEYLTAELEKLGYPRDGGPIDATPAQKAIFALTGVSADRDAARDERDAAIARAEKAERSRDRAKAKVTAGDQPAKLRKFSAVDDKVDDFADAIAGADEVEIVLSDGSHEIEGVDPFVVEGEAWKPTPNGLMLAEPLTLHGPGSGKPAYRVDGYALLLDGKQVAYRQRPEPITVVPGQTYKIENDIIF